MTASYSAERAGETVKTRSPEVDGPSSRGGEAHARPLEAPHGRGPKRRGRGQASGQLRRCPVLGQQHPRLPQHPRGRQVAGVPIRLQTHVLEADGHPGYLATARMLGEAGMLLAEDGATPKLAGCLTPAAALGTASVGR